MCLWALPHDHDHNTMTTLGKLFLSIFALYLVPGPALSGSLHIAKTKCNAHFNNYLNYQKNVPCEVWFGSDNRLQRVKIQLPAYGNKVFDVNVMKQPKAGKVRKDDKWSVCLVRELPSGDEWQLCTVKDAHELKLK